MNMWENRQQYIFTPGLGVLCALMIPIFVVSQTVESSSDINTGWVLATVLNIREHPALDAEVIYQVNEGTRVQVNDIRGDWTEITVDETTGWVYSLYLKLGHYAWVVPDVLNLRSTPSLEARVLAKLVKGKRVLVLKEQPNWASVKAGDEVGWVYSKYLTDTPLVNSQVLYDRRLEFIRNNADLPNVLKQAIRNGTFRIGMSREQVRASMGEPHSINSEDNSAAVQWIYRENGVITYLNFQNGYLSSWSRDIPND